VTQGDECRGEEPLSICWRITHAAGLKCLDSLNSTVAAYVRGRDKISEFDVPFLNHYLLRNTFMGWVQWMKKKAATATVRV
jgi:hypothetical protein